MNNDTLLNVLLQLSYPDILKVCSTTKQHYTFCQQPILWYRLIQRDFEYIDIFHVKNISYEKLYQELYTFYDYYVLDLSKILGNIGKFDMTYDDVWKALITFITNILKVFNTNTNITYHIDKAIEVTSDTFFANLLLHDQRFISVNVVGLAQYLNRFIKKYIKSQTFLDIFTNADNIIKYYNL
jgi:hypothetical protein